MSEECQSNALGQRLGLSPSGPRRDEERQSYQGEEASQHDRPPAARRDVSDGCERDCCGWMDGDHDLPLHGRARHLAAGITEIQILIPCFLDDREDFADHLVGAITVCFKFHFQVRIVSSGFRQYDLQLRER